MPAFFCGIFGHKPSPDIVSNLGGEWLQTDNKDHLYALGTGPMCRYACDLKPMLKVLAGDKAKHLNLDKPVDLAKLKYFYQENDGGALFVTPVDDDVRSGMERVIQHLQSGLNVKPNRVQFEQFKESITIWVANLKTETHGLEYVLANLNGKINAYTELLKWSIGQSKHTLPGLINAIEEKIGIQYGSPKHQLKVKQRNELRKQFEEMLGETGVFIYPTHPTIAPYHKEPITRGFNLSYTGIFNVLGFPSTAVPLGLGKEGLPIGVQIVANHNQDRLCLAVACELERAFGGWVQPELNA